MILPVHKTTCHKLLREDFGVTAEESEGAFTPAVFNPL